MRNRIAMAALATIAALAGCKRDRRPELEQLVRTYVDRVAEAYRTSDASLVDPLVSDAQATKLAALVGVKRDTGVFLDSKLLRLDVLAFRQEKDRWAVETAEQWYYRDRRIGSGAQVGDDSTDAYRVRYWIVRKDGRWIVDDLEFTRPPQVGRKVEAPKLTARQFHGMVEGDAAADAALPPGHPAPAPAAASPEAPAVGAGK